MYVLEEVLSLLPQDEQGKLPQAICFPQQQAPTSPPPSQGGKTGGKSKIPLEKKKEETYLQLLFEEDDN